ncbi:MAG: type II secretion system F family protein [Phycisphaerales bacterium]
MPPTQTQSYLFRAMTPSGGTQFGLRAAGDAGALTEDLKREQLLLMKAWKLPLGPAPTARFPLKDDALMNEQLHTLLSRGVPLFEALEVASSVVSANSKVTVDKLREAVASGSSFSSACEKLGVFDPVAIAVYRSAERTGDLAGAGLRLAQAARRRLAIAGKALTVMIYPAVVSLIALVLFTGLMVFLVPKIAEQMSQLGANVPWFSQIVFSVGVWLNAHFGQLMIMVGAVVVVLILVRRLVVQGLKRLGSMLPGVAPLLLSVELTRFFSVLAAMTRTGVPLSEALATAVPVITDANLRTQLDLLRKNLVEGGVLRVLIEKVSALPLATRRLLVAAERAGDLDSAFDTLSQDMAADVDKQSGRLLALLEPMVIVAMFAVLGPLIIAIAIPLISFTGNQQ